MRADRRDLAAIARVVTEGGYDAVVDTAYDWEHMGNLYFGEFLDIPPHTSA